MRKPLYLIVHDLTGCHVLEALNRIDIKVLEDTTIHTVRNASEVPVTRPICNNGLLYKSNNTHDTYREFSARTVRYTPMLRDHKGEKDRKQQNKWRSRYHR